MHTTTPATAQSLATLAGLLALPLRSRMGRDYQAALAAYLDGRTLTEDEATDQIAFFASHVLPIDNDQALMGR
jgi:Ser/Thr protein kinase RdoA (MazF antagonist)